MKAKTKGLLRPKKLRVTYGLSVYDDKEINAVLSVLKEHRSLIGKEALNFERQIAALFGKKYGVMVNSGSSANLLALELLKLPKGAEVITPALTFSTTVAPILQKGLTPVFVDVDEGTYQINIDRLEAAITDKTSCILVPSLIGNVPDLQRIRKIANDYDLWFIEDSCDALGAKMNGKPTGSYSDISTTSFYGSHIITAAGGGGMICVNDGTWDRRCRILRGWGRSSAVNESEDVSKRFGFKLEGIQYDSKFIFEEIGYNFLPLEISAAFGLEQLKKLEYFIRLRKVNFNTLLKFFQNYKDLFILPKTLDGVDTAWLSFPLTIKDDAPFTRLDLVRYLEENGIQTRPIFAGNILKQPAFRSLYIGKQFPNATKIMKSGLLLGCHHGLTEKHTKYMKTVLKKFLDDVSETR